MEKIILASASPRRRELLAQIGLEFDVVPAKGEEFITKNIPTEIVQELATQKALESAQNAPNRAIIIGADTIVTYNNQILGKPKNEEDAFSMLSMLQGQTHTVYTGVCILFQGLLDETITFAEATEVTVYPMSDEEIYDYIATKDPMDKAGAYGIQGIFARHIQKISGDYYNVVGLPIGRIYQELSKKNRGWL